METMQGSSQCSYLYLKLAKTLCFSFYFLYFFFHKIGEEEGGKGSMQGARGGGPGLGKRGV
jgi:hypothetical protein